MAEFPTTRISLLMRVRDTTNDSAWEEFAATYWPAVYRFARQRGLQDHDAQDLAQNVLAAVAERVADWKPDNDRAHFRTWLARIAMNQTITMFRRRRPDTARGGTTAIAVLNDQATPATDLGWNYRREVFRQLARRVRAEFEEATWQAFWMTAVDGIPVQEAARTLQRSVGSIYTARSRVIRRFQDLARNCSEELEELTAECEVVDE